MHLLLVVGRQLVHMVDNADSVDSIAAAVVDAGILAMLPGTAGIADTAACIAGLQHSQSCMKWPGLLHYFEAY